MSIASIMKIRDPYQLWYEYLKRSENYKEYCSLMRAGKQPTDPKLWDVYYEWGDIYVNSFKSTFQVLQSRRTAPGKAVVDYNCEFRKRALRIIRNHKSATGKKITVGKLLDQIEADLKRSIHLEINPVQGSNGSVLKEVKQNLNQYRALPRTKMSIFLESRNSLLSTDNPRTEDLKIYLAVYDLRKSGKSNAEAVKIMSPRGPGLNAERKYKRYYATAKEIIKNSENGFFPGHYDSQAEKPYYFGVS